jgi:hypothetical protein
MDGVWFELPNNVRSKRQFSQHTPNRYRHFGDADPRASQPRRMVSIGAGVVHQHMGLPAIEIQVLEQQPQLTLATAISELADQVENSDSLRS